MEFDSIKKLGLEISGFVFYLYETYRLFTVPEKIIEIFYLKLIFLLLALPLLYIFRIADFFDWGDTLSYFISSVFKVEHKNIFFQVKLFYHAIYTLLFILLLLETLNYFYDSVI